jgi:glycosyltransferase involved in cell wall biosynthesis
MEPKLSLIVPVYNECGNILPLVQSICDAHAQSGFPYELILVNNGSQDRSAEELAAARGEADWIKVLTLDVNQGYGGGVSAGLKAAAPEATHLGWIPADRQYSIEQTEALWRKVVEWPQAMHKGIRTERFDGANNRLVSHIYSRLARQILALPVKDMNGLPKIFPRKLMKQITQPPAANFLFDCQIMLAARMSGVRIVEHPVTFYARRAGVSSWSSKRIRTYLATFKGLLQMRTEMLRP